MARFGAAMPPGKKTKRAVTANTAVRRLKRNFFTEITPCYILLYFVMFLMILKNQYR
jgi:hypothetical protein